jgi:anaerobic magnesium-protoporphyrin IX monomethyl ester cyclase
VSNLRVLFVYPNARGMNMLPPAIAIFSSLLKQEGHECRLFDTTYWEIPGEGLVDNDKFKEEHLHVRPYHKAPIDVTLKTTDVFKEFVQEVESFDPQLIAVSSTEDMFTLAIKLLSKLSRANRPPVIIGGMVATFAPELVISFDEIDIVCVGDGENALINLCKKIERGMDYSHTQGLWVKKNGTVTKNPMDTAFPINDVPIPDVGLFEEARFYKPFDGINYRTFPIETHRGCPYKCAYCNSPSKEKIYKDAGEVYFRLKNVDGVRRELLHYKENFGAQYFYFWADTFLAWTDQYFEEFADMYKSEIGLPFWCQTRPETLTEKRVSLLKEMGIHRMGLGLEHGNENFRATMLARKVSSDKIVEDLKILNHFDVKYSVNNIIGFPNETRELAMDTIRINRRINADTRNMYTFTPFHGTPLRDIAIEQGLIEKDMLAQSLSSPTVLDMPQFSATSIGGVKRCFVPYVLLEEDRWPEIQKAESFSDEGNAIWEKLIEECRVRFFDQFLPELDDY